MELIDSFLEVRHNEQGEIVVNHPDVGHIVFSVRQARLLAKLLLKHAAEAETEAHP